LTGGILKLDIATTTDLALTPKGNAGWITSNLPRSERSRWSSCADYQADASSGIEPDTYQRLLKEGIHLNQRIGREQNTGSVRVVVVDENCSRMGLITLPATALPAKH
jgi:hypothetical protein